MKKTSLDKIKEYVRDAMSFIDYEDIEKPEGLRAELMEVLEEFYCAKRMSDGKVDNVRERFKEYMMGLPSIFSVHYTCEGQRAMLKEWGIRIPKEDNEVCKLFCKKVTDGFWALCGEYDIDVYSLNK